MEVLFGCRRSDMGTFLLEKGPGGCIRKVAGICLDLQHVLRHCCFVISRQYIKIGHWGEYL